MLKPIFLSTNINLIAFLLDIPPIWWYYIIIKGTEETEMKKYNLSKIMKRAWELVKKSAMTISSGLKKAWEEAKTMEQN